mmetsp:Transcript_17574/g.48539  ORF Transcript_17574/g.48539 Transcript_17574/m.48539 type:complete len:97 (+) Transcript_17574:1465-1755(+)
MIYSFESPSVLVLRNLEESSQIGYIRNCTGMDNTTAPEPTFCKLLLAETDSSQLIGLLPLGSVVSTFEILSLVQWHSNRCFAATSLIEKVCRRFFC